MSVEEIISRDRISFIDYECSKLEVIDKLADTFVKDKSIANKQQFIDKIYERELEYCTYIGHDVAIPHAISSTVRRAGIAFLKSKKAILYGDENETVKLIFMLAIPEHSSSEHLRMLSTLATKLMHSDFRNNLMQAENEDMLYEVLKNIC